MRLRGADAGVREAGRVKRNADTQGGTDRDREQSRDPRFSEIEIFSIFMISSGCG